MDRVLLEHSPTIPYGNEDKLQCYATCILTVFLIQRGARNDVIFKSTIRDFYES